MVKPIKLRGELMIDTKILLSVVIVVLIGVAAAGYHISGQNLGFWQPTTPTTSPATTQSPDTSQGSSGLSSSSSGQEQTTGTGVYSSGTSKTGTGGSSIISSSEARSIAQSKISSSDEIKSVTLSSDKTYYTVKLTNGYLIIDAKTGKVTEGAGSNPEGGVA